MTSDKISVFRTDDVCKLGWFVWKVVQTNNWSEAFDWMLDQ